MGSFDHFTHFSIKFPEQVLQQLNEQLQMNIVQQAQLLQQQQQQVQGNKQSKPQDVKQMQTQLQALQLQQQQLIQHIQLVQRQYFLSQGIMGLPQLPTPGKPKLQERKKKRTLIAYFFSLFEVLQIM